MPASVAYLQPFTVLVTLNGPSTGSVVLELDGSPQGNPVQLTENLAIGQPVTSTATFTIPGPQVSIADQAQFLHPGNHFIGVLFSGDAANYWLPELASVNQVTLSVLPGVTVQSSANPATAGNLVQLTAMINVGGSTAPTGTVTFFDGTTQLGWPVVVSNGQAILPARTFSGGNHSITAVYSGDANYSGATSPALIQMVGQASTTLSLTSSLNPAPPGQPVTFTASLQYSALAGTPTGTIQFLDGTTVLATPAVSAGQAIFSTSTLSAGTHTITATYSGDTTFRGSQNTLLQSIGAASASMQMRLSTSANPSVLGQSLAITATFSPAGNGTPTGTVQFFDGNTSLGTAPVANNQATLTTTALAAGSHALLAQYSGDSAFPATAATIGQVISPLASSVSVTVSASTVAAGQAVTFTARVGPAPPAGFAAQTGQVLFQDGPVPIGTANLTGATATLSVNTLAVGTHTITAVYLGDTTWGVSHATVSVTVSPLFLTNAASNLSTAFAPGEIVSLFGVAGLSGDLSGTPPLGTSLGGISVVVTDSAGTARPAPLYGVFASANQINFVIPDGTAAGPATVAVVKVAGGPAQSLPITIAAAAPGIFSVNQNGQGTFAGQIVLAHADGSQTVESSATGQSGAYVPTPVSFAVSSDQVFLQLYGTGLPQAGTVTATVNGTSVTVVYAGPQGQYPGLDQINLQLPASLVGAGTANIAITANGQAANTVTALIQ
ncbi:MAG TPA: Ig-like domain repeat protein [Bryobacteraceae bacterium]|nr:Ig-like domain repeat protein [Bryobacteraceae bacterium]